MVTFVTGNKNKLAEVKQILSIDFDHNDIDLPEIQGNPESVAVAKCISAYEKIRTPVFIEDVSLCYYALKGLPGPYIKDFLNKLGHEGLYNLIESYDNKNAQAICTVVYFDGTILKKFKGVVDGQIVSSRGSNDFGWGGIFQPDGYDITWGEMDSETRNKTSHRYLAFRQFEDWFNQTQSDKCMYCKESRMSVFYQGHVVLEAPTSTEPCSSYPLKLQFDIKDVWSEIWEFLMDIDVVGMYISVPSDECYVQERDLEEFIEANSLGPDILEISDGKIIIGECKNISIEDRINSLYKISERKFYFPAWNCTILKYKVCNLCKLTEKLTKYKNIL
jgi:inosine triphosphate pyrophosphatase